MIDEKEDRDRAIERQQREDKGKKRMMKNVI